MNAYPIGNDLTVKWSLLYSDGSVFPLSNYDYEFSYRTNRGHKIVTDTSVISVEENILTWTFKSDEQVVGGRYTLCLKITLLGSKVVELQYDNAFMLSPLSGFKGAGSEIVIQSYCDAIDLKDAVLQARKAMDLAADAVIDTAKSAEEAKAAKEAAEITAVQAKADAESAKAMATEANGKVAIAEQAATDASRDAAASQQAAQTASDHITSLEQAIAELPDGQAVSEKVAEHTIKLTELSEKVSELGISIGKEEVDADFEITDKVGNAVVRFQNGHIKTKFFDSSKITTGGGGGGGDGSCYPDLSTKTWCSLGTSITWYNNNQGGKFDKGYQGWLMAKMPIGTLINKGVSGGTIINLAASVSSLVQIADIYTIEHGVNDWGKKSAVGTISDYINNTGNTTFFGAFRIIIDAIYAKNSKAVIILCTPRKARGFNGYLPSSCNGELDGIKLKDYSDAVMEVARYEGLPVCDWFNRCGVNDHNLPIYSIDDALHPNDLGYKQMAQLLIEQFNNIY